MTTMNDHDEAGLRSRLHNVGAAIEARYDEGRGDLFAPRRRHRVTVTVAVVAAAAAVLLVVALVLTRGTESTTTRVADGSGVLDGLELAGPPVTQLVATGRGIVVVANFDDAHDGHPAVYAPDERGVYHWYVNDDVTNVMPGQAWVDGDTIRTVGHECPAVKGKTDASACLKRPLVALSFSLDEMTWADAVTIEPHGLALSTYGAAGNGEILVVPVADDVGSTDDQRKQWSDSIHSTHLARVDVESGDVTRLGSDVLDDPFVCASAGTFLVGSPVRFAPAKMPAGSPVPSDVSPSMVGMVVGDAVQFSTLGLATVTDQNGVVTVSGCVEGGMVASAGDSADGGDGPIIVKAEGGGTSVSTSRSPALPTEWSVAGAVSYGTDITGTVLVATGLPPGEKRADTYWNLAVWDASSSRWLRLDDVPQPATMVAVDQQGRVFVLEHRKRGKTVSWRIRGPIRVGDS